MIKNYFITAFRNFRRNKAFSLINVSGLSIGISAALIIFLIIFYEYSYDKSVPDHDRVYRLVLDAKFGGMDGHSSAVPAPFGNAIQREVTGVELTVPVFQFQGDAMARVSIVQKNNDQPIVFKKQANIVYTGPQYFSLRPYHWIAGSPTTSLQAPFSVVLTESRAKQYFSSLPAEDIIGKRITYNNDITATVSGIVKDMEQPVSFNALEFISLATISQTHLKSEFMMDVWGDWMAYSQIYIKLTKGNDAKQVESQLKMIFRKYNKDADKGDASTINFRLQPLNDMHFDFVYTGLGQRIVQKSTLRGLGALAVFLLLLGCINFINLTTANAAQRAKEIGVRKTMGSSRKQLVFQFLGETFLITATAAIIAVAMTPLLLGVFSDFIPPGLHLDFLSHPYVLLFLFLLVLLVSFTSGLYPALILSGYNPVSVLKSQVFVSKGKTRHAWIRKALTISQFGVAYFFVIVTIIVSKQIHYSMNTDLGFNKDGIITFDTPHDAVVSRRQTLLHAINGIPEIEAAGTGFLSPSDKGVSITNVTYLPKKDLKEPVQLRWGSPEYINVYKIKLLKGRNVTPSDTMKEAIINNTYAKLLGFQHPEDAIGKQLTFNGKNMPVVGVMQDFHDQSMHSIIFPLMFTGSGGSTFHIRFRADAQGRIAWQSGIAKIQKAYKQIYPDADFEYHFYDQTIAAMYANEQQTASLLKWATGISIFISFLGLLGLVKYIIATRTKEIGIRKTLGASNINIVTILSSSFVRLVMIAFLVAAPLAWWAMYKWLQDYAYRTSMSWWVFLLGGLSVLLVVLATMGIQTIRAAVANPVKSLRTE